MSKNNKKAQPAKKPAHQVQQAAPAKKPAVPAPAAKPAAPQEPHPARKPKATRAEAMAASFDTTGDRLGKMADYYNKMASPEAHTVAQQLRRAQEAVQNAKAGITKIPPDAPPAAITEGAIVKLPTTTQERYKTIKKEVITGTFNVLTLAEGRALLESTVNGFQIELAERGLVLVQPAVPGIQVEEGQAEADIAQAAQNGFHGAQQAAEEQGEALV